jgi:anti-sigma-K factor RskA
MTNLPDDPKLDDQIAEFTDMVLDTNEEIDINDTDQQDELVRLQKTILQMKTAVQSAHPDAPTSARIRRNLLLAANKTSDSANTNSASRRRITGIAFAGGFALLVLLGFVLLPIPESGIPLSGTANEASPLLGIIIAAGIILTAIIIWFNRQR